ncbi:hypothetical protein LTR08_005487 [Meristemomyces frigidus]|nr:hypothetical protein LTR08_005487 [Meristemomyces frigidus]
MDLLSAIADCFGSLTNDNVTGTNVSPPTQADWQPLHASEKMERYKDDSNECTESEAVEKLIAVIYDAKYQGKSLEQELEMEVKKTGRWKKAIAKAILAALEKKLATGKKMGPALQRAYDIAMDAAQKMEEFASEHPVLTGVFCAVVALGVLVLLWPAIVEVLGFGELGPIAGSFAAGWQSLYGGRVPYGSIFSYLQRLGMTFKPTSGRCVHLHTLRPGEFQAYWFHLRLRQEVCCCTCDGTEVGKASGLETDFTTKSSGA